jgi:hypothetical protein
MTDVRLEVLEADGTTVVAGPLDTESYHEALVTAPLAAGKYFIRVANSEEWSPSPGAYNMSIGLSEVAGTPE